MKNVVKLVSVSDTLSAISNDKSLMLFNIIALSGGDSSIMISRLNLTRKQYYSKIADLTNAGLIRRKTGRFLLTSFGKVVYEAHVLIGQAVQQIPNLKAIDSIESAEFPNSELIKVIDTLITNDNIKQVLINRERYNNLENEKPLQQTAYSSVLIEKVNEEMKKETSPPPPQLIVGIESEVEAK